MITTRQGLRRSVFCQLASLCVVLFAAAHSIGEEWTSLRVVPEQIVSTRDYPAQFQVLAVDSRGATHKLPLDANSIQIEDPTIADATPDGIVLAKKVGTTNLTIRTEMSSCSATIRVEEDEALTYTREVASALTKSGCNLGTCHGNLFGKGGFRLSLRGDDPLFDFDRITAEYSGRRIDSFDASNSLLLLKGSASISHQGGKRFDVDSDTYRFLHRWIQSGATWGAAPELRTLKLHPAYAKIASSEQSMQLIVQAEFANGTIRDVTRWTRIEPNIPTGVEVAVDGRIKVVRPMDVSFSASYLGGRAASRMIFSAPQATVAKHSLSTSLDGTIDALIEQQCDELGIELAPAASPSTLVRRLYLVTIGRLPTSEETRTFLESDSINRVEELVDRLINDPGFTYTWAMRWSDLLRNEDKVMSAHGAAKFHQWLQTQIAQDRPIREWVSELITSTGSTYENPPASFHRTHRDPLTTAESVGQVFLGVRIQCAKCHNHPFDAWKQDDYYGLAANFTRIDRKQIDNKPKDELDKHIITGDEIISIGDRKAEIRHPGKSKQVGPAPLRFATLENPSENSTNVGPESASSGNELEHFAHWLTTNNAQFDANIANRIWSQYFGRGIVEPPDDFRESNPPTNPKLISHLANELRKNGYSLKLLSRQILVSQAFARESAPDMGELESLSPSNYFAGYAIRRMHAETLLDAVCDVTGIASEYRAGRDEDGTMVSKAIMMPGIPKRPGFLTTFGKPNRLLDCECERSNQVTLGQSLAMVNGTEVREKLVQAGGRIDRLLQSNIDEHRIVDELFLTALNRFPNERERRAAEVLLSDASDRRKALEDLVWALLNSKEFSMIR